jgi:hypothetical protein
MVPAPVVHSEAGNRVQTGIHHVHQVVMDGDAGRTSAAGSSGTADELQSIVFNFERRHRIAAGVHDNEHPVISGHHGPQACTGAETTSGEGAGRLDLRPCLLGGMPGLRDRWRRW